MRRNLPSLTRSIAALLLAAVAAVVAVPAAAADVPPRARVIVKFKPEAGEPAAGRVDGRSGERVGILAARSGLALNGQRALGPRVRLVTAQGISSQELARRLAADPEVAYAVPDRRMRPLFVPNDPLFEEDPDNSPETGQWYLRKPSGEIESSIDAVGAWDLSKGDGVTVAVLDTGVRFEHPDLRRREDGGKLLDGYDFIRREEQANDGDGRDDDPSDPGDWVTVQEVQADPNDDLDESCVRDPSSGQLTDVDSSWHGTEVAGILGAITNNRRGMAGAGHNVRLLPVRVLGKCGGFSSDIVLAMRWAAGIPVDGVPDNPNPAKILNLSLGGSGACGDDYADAIADVRAEGATVVVSAGNSAGHAVSEPANCDGVIAVAGLRHSGTKVGFSDLGPEVAISAPGGNCVFAGANQPCQYPLLSTTNSGTRGPASSIYSDGQNRLTVGTSFSAPLVSGTLALALAVRPQLEPDDLRALVRRTARKFPTSGAASGTPQCQAPRDDVEQDECYCTTDTCGAGMLDAAAAVAAARGVIPRIRLEGEAPAADRTVTLSAADSLPTAGGTITRVAWQIVDGNGIVERFETTSGQRATVRPSAGGEFTVRATVTDSTGATAAVDRTVRVSGSGRDDDDNDWGSGALGGGWLAALLAAVLAARRAVRRDEGEAGSAR
jgi:serine protease